MAYYWREIALLLIPLAMLAGIFAVDPIAQDPAYHAFADARALLGIPNFANVVSNVAFLVVGIAGLLWLWRQPRTPTSAPWIVLFTGVALVCFGSGYYHASPESATLVWDRLPMTVAFMGLLVALLGEHLNPSLVRYLLGPAIALGFASVVWWHYTDDLRFYIWIQAAPLLAIPLVLLLFPARYSHRRYLLYGLGFYVAAKIAELYDNQMLAGTADVVSGHTLKHLLAATGVFCVYAMLRRRAPL